MDTYLIRLVRMCGGYVAVVWKTENGQKDVGLGLHFILLPPPQVND